LTIIVERAGFLPGKWRAYSSFIFGKSTTFFRKTVDFTTSSIDAPSLFNMLCTF
jgi:hypothetical protein